MDYPSLNATWVSPDERIFTSGVVKAPICLFDASVLSLLLVRRLARLRGVLCPATLSSLLNQYRIDRYPGLVTKIETPTKLEDV